MHVLSICYGMPFISGMNIFVTLIWRIFFVRLRRGKNNRLIQIGTFIFVRDRRGSDLQNPTCASLFTLNYEVKNPFQIFCPTCARIRLRRVRLRRVLLYIINLAQQVFARTSNSWFITLRYISFSMVTKHFRSDIKARIYKFAEWSPNIRVTI